LKINALKKFDDIKILMRSLVSNIILSFSKMRTGAAAYLKNPESVSETRIRVPENAELNETGTRIVEMLTQINGVRRNSKVVVLDKSCLVHPNKFKKNDGWNAEPDELVIAGIKGYRSMISSPIVFKVGKMVFTASGSIYHLGEEITVEELKKIDGMYFQHL